MIMEIFFHMSYRLGGGYLMLRKSNSSLAVMKSSKFLAERFTRMFEN